ncbi:MAG: HEAT repeat domain-containing protein [Armatimonadia bacterium]
MHRLHLCALLIAVCSLGLADETEWLRQLGSPDPQAGQAAVTHFAAQGAKAVPLLRQVLQSDDLLARQYAAVALARIGKPGADRVLMRLLLTWDDPLLQQFCGEALAARGKAIVPLLRRELALDRPAESIPESFAKPQTEDEQEEADAREKAREEAENIRTLVFGAIWNLPPSLALPLCAEYVSRPEGNRQDPAKVYFVDQGVPGLRLWAKSYLSQTGIPDIETVNRAWQSYEEQYDWEEFTRRWTIDSRVTPSGYEISLDNDAARNAVRQVANEAFRAPSATQRLWAVQHLAMADTEREGDSIPVDFYLRALTDPCWAVPLVVLERGDELTECQPLLPALRALTTHPCDPLRLAAVETLAPSADPAALEALSAMLTRGTKKDQEKAASVIEYNSSDWTDEQKLSFVKLLLDAHDTHEYSKTHNALVLMPPAAWAEVAERSKTIDPIARADYLSIIGELRAKEAAPTILRALDDPDAQVRESALQALALVSPEDARPHLERLFNSGEPKAEQSAYLIARRADDPALLARFILTKPQLAVPPLNDRDSDDSFGIPAVKDEWVGPGERSRTTVPELLDTAKLLFADEHQPERVRVMAAETILKASVPQHYMIEGTASAASLSLSPDLWPVLEFALKHFPRGLGWDPNEADPIEDAAWLVRDPAAVPTLVAILSSLDVTASGPGTGAELTSAIVFSLLQTKPEGEEAYWKVLAESETDAQVGLLRALQWGGERPSLNQHKLDQAYLRLLRNLPAGSQHLLEVTGWVKPGTQAALEAQQAVKEAYAKASPDERTRGGYLAVLPRLGDPDAETLYLGAINRRDAAPERRRAIGMLRVLKTPNVLQTALSIANSDFELYWMRYSALRAVEKHNPALARQIARRWTRDWRYQMRDCGRTLLAGEEKGYL